MYKKRIIIAAVAVLLVGTAVWAAHRAIVHKAAPAAASPPLTVAVQTVHTASKTPGIKITGSIEAFTEAVISAKIPGRIAAVVVDDGQAVNAGDTLVQLESVELVNQVTMAENALAQAQATYDDTATNYQRYRALYDQNAIPRQQLDAMYTKLRLAEGEVSRAQAALGNARQQYDYAAVTAPVAGVVANKQATVGQVVAAGSPLMAVDDISQVYAVINVPQQDMGLVRPGLAATVTADAYPGETFNGTVAVINPAAAQGTRDFKVKIVLPNADGRLRPGMFVQVNLTTGQAQTVLAVPQRALFQKQGLYYVYVINDDQATRQNVQVGDPLGDNMEVVAGLNAGDAVAVSNVTTLKDGDAVQVAQ